MKRYVTFKVKSGENTTNTLRIKTPTGKSITATIIYHNAIASFTLSGMDKYIDTTVPIDLDSAIESLLNFKLINGMKPPYIIEACDKIIDFISDYQDEIINNRINSSENSIDNNMPAKEEPKDNLEEPAVKKYKFTGEYRTCGKSSIHQIIALKNIVIDGIVVVKEGMVGGWIENEMNLPQTDDSWIYSDSIVMGNSVISGKTLVSNSHISSKNDKSIRIDSDRLTLVKNSIIDNTELDSTNTHIIDTCISNNRNVLLSNSILSAYDIIDNDENMTYMNFGLLDFKHVTEDHHDNEKAFGQGNKICYKNQHEMTNPPIDKTVDKQKNMKKETSKIKDKTSDLYKDLDKEELKLDEILDSIKSLFNSI